MHEKFGNMYSKRTFAILWLPLIMRQIPYLEYFVQG